QHHHARARERRKGADQQERPRPPPPFLMRAAREVGGERHEHDEDRAELDRMLRGGVRAQTAAAQRALGNVAPLQERDERRQVVGRGWTRGATSSDTIQPAKKRITSSRYGSSSNGRLNGSV